MAEPDPQRTLAEAAAAEPAVSAPMERYPSDAATVGSEAPPLAALQGLGPGGGAAPASEGPPQGFGAVGEPASAAEEPPTVGRSAVIPLMHLGSYAVLSVSTADREATRCQRWASGAVVMFMLSGLGASTNYVHSLGHCQQAVIKARRWT